MTTSIPTTEPERIRAGDTLQWRREDLTSDYPASAGWSLIYRFKHPTQGGFEITASADGAAFAVTVSAATSGAYPSGIYDYIGYVSKAGEVHTVAEGRLTVDPDLRAANADTPLDTRSHARRVLAAIEAAIENRADAGQLETVSRTIAARGMQRDPLALQRLRDVYRHEVRRELQAERVAKGLPSGRGAYVRFGRA